MSTPKSHAERLAILRSGLYVLTDGDLRPDRSAEEITRAAIAGGAATIQLRAKRYDTQTTIGIAKKLCRICRDAGVLFIVNDRVDIALASDADGVHLGPDDMLPADARRLMGPNAIIGVSVSTIEEAEPISQYASYLGVGAIFGTKTKLDAGDAVGTGRIKMIRSAFRNLPIVAIGGINAANIAETSFAGAEAAAVVSAVICAGNMIQATQELGTAFKNSRK